MNVDEAMEAAKRESLGWYDDMFTAGPILANEVERLRAELADTENARDSWRRVCEKETEAKHQAWAALAAAKAASVLPVDAAVMPSVDGLRRYADTDGRYIANCDLGDIGTPCTCKPICTEPCKGGCGCDACREAYGDFLSSQD